MQFHFEVAEIDEGVVFSMKKMSFHTMRIELVLMILIFWPLVQIWKHFPELQRSVQIPNASVLRLKPTLSEGFVLKPTLTFGDEHLSQMNAVITENYNRQAGNRHLKNGLHEQVLSTLSDPTVEQGISKPKTKLFRPGLCDGKRIFMYDLPQEFNSLVLEQCDRKVTEWLNFCPHLDNHGFGVGLNKTSGWYATDFYMLEIIFHARMRQYGCLTADFSEADAFFIPYYSGLDALRFLYGKDRKRAHEQGLGLISWLEENAGEAWKKWRGVDHFFVMGRTAWDFIGNGHGWGTSLRERPALANVTTFLLERRPWQGNEQAIPYPTSFHPPSLNSLDAWLSSVRSSRRQNLFTFIGAPRPGRIGSIRQAVLNECLDSPSECGLLDCQKIRCAHNPEPIRDKLLISDFCLQPPGDSPTRRSTFDGLIAGCIPVLFDNNSAYTQYNWHLPADPDQYSVFISPSDLRQGAKVRDVLRGYSKERIIRMRENIIKLIPGLIYVSSSAAVELGAAGIKDAFDLSLEAMLSKAKAMKSAALKAQRNAK